MSLQLSSLATEKQLLHPCPLDDEQELDSLDESPGFFATLAKLRTKQTGSLTPEDLCKVLLIGLLTATQSL